MATQISAGANTCALTPSGGVKCWGFNLFNLLGDGSSVIYRNTPVDVLGLTSGVAALAVRGNCAITTAGGAKCWGGVDADNNPVGPVDVPGLSSGVRALVGPGPWGLGCTCALTTGGGVKCKGERYCLGDGSFMFSENPSDFTDGLVDVVGLEPGVAALSDYCAVFAASAPKCWGYNDVGQLGDGTTDDAPTPVDVAGLASGVVSLSSGGEHKCAVTSAGGVKCWGSNGSGQLGDGTTEDRSTPVDVVGLETGVAAVSAGSDHTCALSTSGRVKCWGGNEGCELGNGTCGDEASSRIPADVVGLDDDVAAISAGNDYTCALTAAGRVKCWGANGTGELGDGTFEWSPTPVDVLAE